jgi:hypothetical protein
VRNSIFAACAGDVIAQLVVDSTRLGTSQPSGSDYRMPEEHSEKSNHNNAKDKTPRVAIKGLVVGGQPVGIAHAKLLWSPAGEPTSPDIDKDFLNPF